MTRRLLGYVVKLPDGTRFSGTPKPCSRDEAESFGDDIEGWVVPVFSKPKPAVLEPAPLPPNPTCFCCGVGVEPGPRDDGFTDGERVACGHCGATNYPTVADDGTVEMSDGAEDEGDETKPAPVVSAEPDAYLIEMENGGWQVARSFCGSLEDGETLVPLYRHPPEAALAAAREEGQREAAGRIARLVDALQSVLDGCSELTPHAIVEIEYVLEEEREEAAKGQAK